MYSIILTSKIGISDHGRMQGGKNGHFPHLEIVTKNQKFLENLKLAAKLRLFN